MITLIVLFLFFLLACIGLQYVQHRKVNKLVDHLLEENKGLKNECVKAAIDAQEKERREIGRDLHDELGSTLLTMKMNLGLIEKQGLFIFESSDALKELKYSLDNSIEYVKGISRVTSPAFLENFGLSRAVVQMVKRINSSCVAKVQFEETGNMMDLSKEKQLHVYRIIQEVINNALRYASPWRIFVTFEWGAKFFTVEIRDDGYNYRYSEKYQSAGLGLNNIMNRASLIGAEFSSDDLSQGNLARIRVPYEAVAENQHLPG